MTREASEDKRKTRKAEDEDTQKEGRQGHPQAEDKDTHNSPLSMAFAVFIELLNIRYRKVSAPVALHARIAEETSTTT